MPQFTVHLVQTVSSSVTVDAETYEEAIEAAWDSEDMPGSMSHGAFGSASVDEAGEWMAQEVTDDSGNSVWRDV